jgi:hypothetical protein
VPVLRDRGTTYIVGTALADTVLAGPGNLRPSDLSGNWRRVTEPAVYGQVVRVDSLAGAGDSTVRRALDQRHPTVVVVPWDYDAACQPIYRNGSAQWATPGLSGFYRLALRPPASWAGGRPTFNAFIATIQPYPHGSFLQAGYRGSDALRYRPSLTEREMFSFYAVLPTFDVRGDSASLEPLRRWVAEHPELAVKYPADRAVEWLLRR